MSFFHPRHLLLGRNWINGPTRYRGIFLILCTLLDRDLRTNYRLTTVGFWLAYFLLPVGVKQPIFWFTWKGIVGSSDLIGSGQPQGGCNFCVQILQIPDDWLSITFVQESTSDTWTQSTRKGDLLERRLRNNTLLSAICLWKLHSASLSDPLQPASTGDRASGLSVLRLVFSWGYWELF